MKSDVLDLPPVPRKRRQIEGALDLHIALWLDSDDLRPADRRNLQNEKARRKALSPQKDVGVLVSPSGARPEQIAALRAALMKIGATAVGHLWQAGKVPAACRAAGVPTTPLSGHSPQDLIRACDEMIVLVSTPARRPYAEGGAWGWIGYARHRGLPVTVIWPDCQTEGVQ